MSVQPTAVMAEDDPQSSLRLHLTDSAIIANTTTTTAGTATATGAIPTTTATTATPSSTLPPYEESLRTSRTTPRVQLQTDDLNKTLPTTTSSEADGSEAAAAAATAAHKVTNVSIDNTIGTHWPGNDSRDGQRCAYTSLHAVQAQNCTAFKLRQASQQDWPKIYHKVHIRPIRDVDDSNLKKIPDQGSCLENNLLLLAEEFRQFFSGKLTVLPEAARRYSIYLQELDTILKEKVVLNTAMSHYLLSEVAYEYNSFLFEIGLTPDLYTPKDIETLRHLFDMFYDHNTQKHFPDRATKPNFQTFVFVRPITDSMLPLLVVNTIDDYILKANKRLSGAPIDQVPAITAELDARVTEVIDSYRDGNATFVDSILRASRFTIPKHQSTRLEDIPEASGLLENADISKTEHFLSANSRSANASELLNEINPATLENGTNNFQLRAITKPRSPSLSLTKVATPTAIRDSGVKIWDQPPQPDPWWDNYELNRCTQPTNPNWQPPHRAPTPSRSSSPPTTPHVCQHTAPPSSNQWSGDGQGRRISNNLGGGGGGSGWGPNNNNNNPPSSRGGPNNNHPPFYGGGAEQQ